MKSEQAIYDKLQEILNEVYVVNCFGIKCDAKLSLSEYEEFSDKDFIEDIYIKLLNRYADTSGLKSYGDRLKAGAKRISIIESIMGSEEAKDKKVYIEDLPTDIDNPRDIYYSELKGMNRKDLLRYVYLRLYGIGIDQQKLSRQMKNTLTCFTKTAIIHKIVKSEDISIGEYRVIRK